MPIITLVITLVVIGLILWLVNTYIPMDAKIKNILNIVVLIAVVLWLLSVFGILGNLSNARVPKVGMGPAHDLGVVVGSVIV